MMTWEKHRKILMKDPEVRKAWEETRLEREIAHTLIRTRIEKRLTQAQLAKRLKTKQSVISRVESGQTTPSLSFLKRLAEVLDLSLSVQFK
ncbi:MAG: helix-turn-helix transcriptional regulator [Candidatus Daviesbacteria bacterium]|nr:helix-turn-helix transcriptional regulator [Candidatus Daviesbacteria bacterium]